MFYQKLPTHLEQVCKMIACPYLTLTGVINQESFCQILCQLVVQEVSEVNWDNLLFLKLHWMNVTGFPLLAVGTDTVKNK